MLLRIVIQEVKVSAVIALTKSAAKTRCMQAQHVAGAELERKILGKEEEVQRENKHSEGRSAFPLSTPESEQHSYLVFFKTV